MTRDPNLLAYFPPPSRGVIVRQFVNPARVL